MPDALEPVHTAGAPSGRAALPSSVSTTVKVFAREQSLREGISAPYEIGREEVLSSAGTFGDFTRYLQVMPGVAWNNDFTNELMVRGGNPAENLFVVDGIEVPNLNHFALEGTSGGFTSMVDTSLIENVDLTPGNYESSYSRRLSSLVEIQTREMPRTNSYHQMDLGISGLGGLMQRRIAPLADITLAAHRSLLNLATNDIGINGVPIYESGLAEANWTPENRDHIRFLDVSGADSVMMNPEPCDPGVSSPIHTAYEGLRSTTGLLWQHFPSERSASTLSGSYSFQDQNIGQEWQLMEPHVWPCTVQSLPVYGESTRDRIGALTYRGAFQAGSWLFSFGQDSQVVNLNYQVAQPLGEQSPFSTNPAWTDADNFARALTAGLFAQFAEANARLTNRLNFIAGAREEEFGLTGARMLDPRASLACRLSEHQAFSVDIGRSGQLPPTMNILSYASNNRLAPITVNQLSLGAQLWNGSKLNVSVQGYGKQYFHEPVSTEYPGLMLTNMVDTLAQQFVWLPMASTGHGRSDGMEVMIRARADSRFRAVGSFTWSKTVYAAADGVMRPGNFDLPIVANVMSGWRGFHGVEFTMRESYATGRPYTPFNVPLSEAQQRGIYDLTQINAVRAQAYNRLDLDMNRDYRVWGKTLNLHVGVENALDRHNFFGYVWLDSCSPNKMYCGTEYVGGTPELLVSQMRIFPDASLRYVF